MREENNPNVSDHTQAQQPTMSTGQTEQLDLKYLRMTKGQQGTVVHLGFPKHLPKLLIVIFITMYNQPDGCVNWVAAVEAEVVRRVGV